MARIAVLGEGTLGAALRAARWTGTHQLVAATRRPRAASTAALDVTDAAAVRRFFDEKGPFDLVVNAAAMTDVDACERDPAAARAANATAVRSIALECARTGAALLHVSTNYVFPGGASSPYGEDDAAGPCSIYGITKLEGEWHALAHAPRAAVVRTSWIFGGEKRDFVRHFLEKFEQPGDLPVVSDQTASLTYAKDLAGGLEPLAAALLARPGKPFKRVYHLTNAGDCTRYEMVVVMKECLKKPNAVRKVSRQGFESWAAVRPLYSVLSNARYAADFGCALRPWRDALVEYLKA